MGGMGRPSVKSASIRSENLNYLYEALEQLRERMDASEKLTAPDIDAIDRRLKLLEEARCQAVCEHSFECVHCGKKLEN